MAERRMFTKKVTDGDAFTSMPPTAQALYFHLCMSADDDGFSNNIRIAMFNAHASTDDFNTLICKKFIIPFDSGVIVIKHWKMHNYIQNDRYHETKYIEEKASLVLKENGVYKLDTECIQNGYRLDTEVRLGKERIGKDSLGKTSQDKTSLEEGKTKPKKEPSVPVMYYPNDEYLDNTLKEFIKMRKTIKAPMTDRAIELLMSKLEKLATHDGAFDNDLAVNILNQSIENSWKGIFELKDKGKKNNKNDSILEKWMNA